MSHAAPPIWATVKTEIETQVNHANKGKMTLLFRFPLWRTLTGFQVTEGQTHCKCFIEINGKTILLGFSSRFQLTGVQVTGSSVKLLFKVIISLFFLF